MKGKDYLFPTLWGPEVKTEFWNNSMPSLKMLPMYIPMSQYLQTDGEAFFLRGEDPLSWTKLVLKTWASVLVTVTIIAMLKDCCKDQNEMRSAGQ